MNKQKYKNGDKIKFKKIFSRENARTFSVNSEMKKFCGQTVVFNKYFDQNIAIFGESWFYIKNVNNQDYIFCTAWIEDVFTLPDRLFELKL